ERPAPCSRPHTRARRARAAGCSRRHWATGAPAGGAPTTGPRGAKPSRQRVRPAAAPPVSPPLACHARPPPPSGRRAVFTMRRTRSRATKKIHAVQTRTWRQLALRSDVWASVIAAAQMVLEEHVQHDEHVAAAHLLKPQLRHSMAPVGPGDGNHL